MKPCDWLVSQYPLLYTTSDSQLTELCRGDERRILRRELSDGGMPPSAMTECHGHGEANVTAPWRQRRRVCSPTPASMKAGSFCLSRCSWRWTTHIAAGPVVRRLGKRPVRTPSHQWLVQQNLKPNSITLAGSELVRSWFEAKCHYAIWIEPASNQLRTSSEPGSEPAPNQLA